jgi:hypothetical protein
MHMLRMTAGASQDNTAAQPKETTDTRPHAADAALRPNWSYIQFRDGNGRAYMAAPAVWSQACSVRKRKPDFQTTHSKKTRWEFPISTVLFAHESECVLEAFWCVDPAWCEMHIVDKVVSYMHTVNGIDHVLNRPVSCNKLSAWSKILWSQLFKGTEMWLHPDSMVLPGTDQDTGPMDCRGEFKMKLLQERRRAMTQHLPTLEATVAWLLQNTTRTDIGALDLFLCVLELCVQHDLLMPFGTCILRVTACTARRQNAPECFTADLIDPVVKQCVSLGRSEMLVELALKTSRDQLRTLVSDAFCVCSLQQLLAIEQNYTVAWTSSELLYKEAYHNGDIEKLLYMISKKKTPFSSKQLFAAAAANYYPQTVLALFRLSRRAHKGSVRLLRRPACAVGTVFKFGSRNSIDAVLANYDELFDDSRVEIGPRAISHLVNRWGPVFFLEASSRTRRFIPSEYSRENDETVLHVLVYLVQTRGVNCFTAAHAAACRQNKYTASAQYIESLLDKQGPTQAAGHPPPAPEN